MTSGSSDVGAPGGGGGGGGGLQAEAGGSHHLHPAQPLQPQQEETILKVRPRGHEAGG